ncbi:uncharacterized protein CBL_08997 [Carabus blaptoides fortunei]
MVRSVLGCAIVTLLCVVSMAGGEQKQLIERLHRILDFLVADATKVDVDCLFGVVIAEAQLNLLLNSSVDPDRMQQISRLRSKCELVRSTVRKLVQVPDEANAKILNAVLRPAGWQVDNGFSLGNLELLPILPWPATTQDLVDIIYEGSPLEEESDSCIAQLVGQGTPEERHICKISEECVDIMMDFDDPCHGYPLTHRLLYMQSFRALNCFTRKEEFNTLKQMLCSRIYQEFRTLESLDLEITRDLYLEQLVLCGLEGYAEFLHRHARTSILEWQNSVGCYGRTVELLAARERTKRATVLMSHGCDSHMTGLGIAALALNLRYLHGVNY